MSWITIEDKSSETVELTGTNNYLFTNKAKITVKADDAGVLDDRGSTKFSRTLILNDDVSVSENGTVYGIKSTGSYMSASGTVPSLIVRSADKATKLTVTSKDTAYGIYFYHVYSGEGIGNLEIGSAGESFKRTISVTASNSAYGVYSGNNLSFMARFAAPVTVKASVKDDSAYAYALYAENMLKFNEGIGADISATASGTDARAYALYGVSGITVNGDIAGKVNSTATASGNMNYAYSYGLYAEKNPITVTGKIKSAVTVKATHTKNSSYAKAIWADSGKVILGGIAADVSATASGKGADAYAIGGYSGITVSGDIAGKITATATATQDDAYAYGFFSSGNAIGITGKIRSAVTAKATVKGDSSAYVRGISAGTTVTLGGIAADITATGSAKKATVYAVYGSSAITVNGDIAGKVTASATTTTSAATAYGLQSADDSVSINGKIKSAMTIKSTSKNNSAFANGIFANTSISLEAVAADISITASGTAANTYALYGYESTTVNGDIAGKITATASGTTGVAESYGLYSKSGVVAVNGAITKSVTVKATSKGKDAIATALGSATMGVKFNSLTADVSVTANGRDATAYGIYGTADSGTGFLDDPKIYAVHVTGVLAGKINASATSTMGDATVEAICTSNGMILLAGGITANITATAASGTDYGTVYAYGIHSADELKVTGRITGTLTVKATSKSGMARAYGIFATGFSTHRDLGTVNVTSDDDAFGWDASTFTSDTDMFTGKATVTAKTNDAYGMCSNGMTGHDYSAATATLEITATGKMNAYGFSSGSGQCADLTLKDSKITAKVTDKSGNAYSLYGSFGSNTLTLDHSTLTGDVSLSDDTSDDTLVLKNKSTVTGDINMGEGTDTVKIHSGSLVKGDIDNSETITLKITDAATAKSVLWEDAIVQAKIDVGSVVLDVSRAIGETGTYALIKDTDGSGWGEYEFILYLDGINIGETLTVNSTVTDVSGHYTYTLTESKDRKTLSLVIGVRDDDEYTISEAQTNTVSLVTDQQDYLFTAKGKVNVKEGEIGIDDQRNDTYTFDRTLILNNDITVTNKSGSADIYGVQSIKDYGERTSTPGDPTLALRNVEKATKLTVTNDSGDACGIFFEHSYEDTSTSKTVQLGTLQIGGADESFKQTISVTANHSSSTARARGMYSSTDITFNALLAAPITVKATAKKNWAGSYGIYAQNAVTFGAGIATDITVTANSASKAAFAHGIYQEFKTTTGSGVFINGDITGKITATAAGNKEDSESTEASAIMSYDSEILVSGKITKALSAKASSKARGACAYVMRASTNLTLKSGITANITATADSFANADAYGISGGSAVKITGDVAGKVTVTASSSGTNYFSFLPTEANAFYSNDGYIVFYDRITNAVTAKATAKYASASASGIMARNAVTLKNGLDADITATATGADTADAFGIAQYNTGTGADSITINGDIAGKITATATASSASAYALMSEKDIVISGRITKAMTVKATSKDGTAFASGLYATNTSTLGGIAADITATASGTTASAYAVYGASGVTVNGDVAGKITASATATSTAIAYGFYSKNGSAGITGSITKAMTIKATSKEYEANAYGIYAAGTTVTLDGIAADISIAATSRENAYACAIRGYSSITVGGDVTGKITATATATTGDARAYGFYSPNDGITISGGFTKAITVSAVSKTGAAVAYAVAAESNTLTFDGNLGTVNVTASGAGSNDYALGWSLCDVVTTSGTITGKANVTCKTGTVFALTFDTITGSDPVVATLDITATGKDANGINFRNDKSHDCTMTLKDSKITAKGDSATALFSSMSSVQNITLDNSVLTGAVVLDDGNDSLILTNKSKITGDVDMGDGTDTVKIHSGCQVKGEIDNAENIWLVLDDASAAKTALWEGDIDQSAFGETLRLDIATAAIGIGEYTLMKDTAADSWTGTKFKLYLDGSDSGVSLAFDGKSVTAADSPYEYKLTSDNSGKSLILAVTEKA